MVIEALIALGMLLVFALASINGISKALEILPSKEVEKLFPVGLQSKLDFALVLIKTLLRFSLALISLAVLQHASLGLLLLSFLFLTLFYCVVAEMLPILAARKYPEQILMITRIPANILLTLTAPLTYLLLGMLGSAFKLNRETPIAKAKKKISAIVDKIGLSEELSLQDIQLIESVLDFKDRIAREVMVPRVDVFSLPCDTSIKDAAKLIDIEGYSRIPIFRDTVDNIVGVLMYKDILKKYMEYSASDRDENILNAPIETIQKSVLYTPETKRISNLLLEFRKKQSHLAIVVDEYGGTEGIVTIEDILEEIVGEIADEYDEEEDLYHGLPDGSFIVDARMNILDVQEQLEITIPQEGEYDTVGGFIFHTAGSIPPRGFQIHHENFELEVLKSDDRRIHKVKLKKN